MRLALPVLDSNVTDSGALHEMEELGVRFGGITDIEDFAELYSNLHNSLRMQCNRGFTPEELYAMEKPEDRIPRSMSFGPNNSLY